MCAPCVVEAVKAEINRRSFLGLLGAAAAGASMAKAKAQGFAKYASYSNVQDLTHTLSAEFPLFPGFEPMKVNTLVTVKQNGFYVNRLELGEHSGTHMDAPAHFVDAAATAENIPANRLVAPLVVLHIHQRAASNPDAQVQVDDILAWERRHGLMPAGSLVAMHSGWADRVADSKRFLNQDSTGTLHFPGFSPEAADFLVSNRDIVGIAVDTLSLDFGPSQDFKTHLITLGAGKYGLENVANLDLVPEAGATVFVGGPKHKNASGGPSRVMAVW